MHLIVCVEENGGLSFCGRRLSSDRVVTEYIRKMTAGSKLWMNRYSSTLFPDDSVAIDEEFWEKAGEADYCFLENIPIPADTRKIRSVTVFHWNRRYPSTVKLHDKILAGRELVERVEFAGNSHDLITMQRYQ